MVNSFYFLYQGNKKREHENEAQLTVCWRMRWRRVSFLVMVLWNGIVCGVDSSVYMLDEEFTYGIWRG
jgi:hypothetical protein